MSLVFMFCLARMMYMHERERERERERVGLDERVEELRGLALMNDKEANPLEMRIADAAYAAEDVIESHIFDQIHAGSKNRGKKISSIDFCVSLQSVIDEIDSIKKEVINIKEKKGIQDQLQKNPTPSSSRSSSAFMGQNPVVGFDNIKHEVMDKLIGGQLDRQIIPIVGMAGIGEHLSEEDGEDEYELGVKLYQRLWGRRYLIVMDDIWDIKVWEQLRTYFPNNSNGSKIVLTTRISNFHLSDSNYVLKMGFLDKHNSWILFSKIVLGEEGSCPLELEEIGKEIVENCRGLPLSIVVVGGLLARSKQTREYWEYIAKNLNSIVNLEEDEHCLKVLHMSYNHLPVHLKPCFLYMGVFSEDKKIPVSKLIRLWVAEGFLKPCSDGKSLEEIAKEYLIELIDRNMVLVHQLGCIGNIKNCHIHDLFRDLCLREAEKQRFINVIRPHSVKSSQDASNQRRVVIPKVSYQENALNALQSMSRVSSLTFWDSRDVLQLYNFRLLRIMSFSSFNHSYYHEHVLKLVNSRYIVLNLHRNAKFLSSICLLWNLHTIIIETGGKVTAPVEIWDMPQLRHLMSRIGIYLPPPRGGNTSRRGDVVLMNLEILGRVINFKCCDDAIRRIPNVKKLKILFDGEVDGNCLAKLGELQKLESFRCYSLLGVGDILHNHTFPRSLRRLTLSLRAARSEDVLGIVGALPLLEKLVFIGMFEGRVWETVEGQFRSLKFLKLEDCPGLDIWTTESSHFPRLEHLVLVLLEELQVIPPEIGEITTLKSLKLVECRNSAVESAKRIQEDQEDNFGEVSLQVEVQISDYDQIQELQSLRYLIVMDDIWDIKVWEQLRRYFPDNQNGSRIVLTTRTSNFHLSDSNYVLKMGFLDKHNSWILFSKIVFGEEGCCRLELEEIGKEIILENCRGLPLSIVVVGGLLARSEHTPEYWEYIEENLNSIVNSEDDESCLKLLYMSYSELPVYLKPCFLYTGVFSEDRNIHVSELVSLWAAEGFLKPSSGKSSEEIADECLKELISRNLVSVQQLGSTGNIKYCSIHDLLRDLCLREAQKESFFTLPQELSSQRRVVITHNTSPDRVLDALPFMSLARSLICDSKTLLPLRNLRLMRIMSCPNFDYSDCLKELFKLVNLRYVVLNARWVSKIPSSIYRLWNLRTLIVHIGEEESGPFDIWNMSQLRHLEFEKGLYLADPPGGQDGAIALVNLQVLGTVINYRWSDEVIKRIPSIKELKVDYYHDSLENGWRDYSLDNLDRLHNLESLRCQLVGSRAADILLNLTILTFPRSLKKLTLKIEGVFWEETLLEKIGSFQFDSSVPYPSLRSFKGRGWETVEGQFRSLKFLQLDECKDMEFWTTESSHFPRLERLVLTLLEDLNEIPSEIGEIETLKSIKLIWCSRSAIISTKRIIEGQEELYGEVGLQVQVLTRGLEQREELQSFAVCPNFQFVGSDW
ncbi:hypothetical protein ACS0TY_035324 [Phlomoides rotata]